MQKCIFCEIRPWFGGKRKFFTKFNESNNDLKNYFYLVKISRDKKCFPFPHPVNQRQNIFLLEFDFISTSIGKWYPLWWQQCWCSCAKGSLWQSPKRPCTSTLTDKSTDLRRKKWPRKKSKKMDFLLFVFGFNYFFFSSSSGNVPVLPFCSSFHSFPSADGEECFRTTHRMSFVRLPKC